MLKKVDKVFIGKYIERTSTLVDGLDMATLQGDIVEGEILILDADYNIVEGDSATYTNTKKIYIAEGSSESFSTYYPDGTTLTGRRLLISNAIVGSKVSNYTGGAYSAKSEAVATLPAISDTISSGTEYVLRIVYKGDIATQHPGQNTETYRYTAASGDTSSDVYDKFVSKINKRYLSSTIKKAASQLITAENDGGVLTITALPVTGCTTSVDDIDELAMNNFAVYLNYVDSDYNWQEVTLSSDKSYTGADRGYGSWETIRDIEKRALAYEGISNYTHWPVIKPDMRTVKDAEYDMIVIEHEAPYRSSDNQYNKETSLVQVIALASGTTATTPQNAELLATLNTWMASVPGEFDAVSFS
jgi:hypothetical protein